MNTGTLNKITVTLMAMMCLPPAMGEDLKLKDGTVYKKFSVVKQEADALKIEHTDGIAKVAVELLPDDVKKRYQWDPKLIKEVREKAVKARAEKEEQEKATKEDATAKAAADAEAAEWLQRRIARTKSEAVEAGAYRVWMVGAQNTTVETPFGVKPGTSYLVAVENTGTKALTGKLRGTVFIQGTGDEPREYRLSVPAGETKIQFVESIITPGRKTRVLVELLSNAGSSLGSAEVDAEASMLDFMQDDREK